MGLRVGFRAKGMGLRAQGLEFRVCGLGGHRGSAVNLFVRGTLNTRHHIPTGTPYLGEHAMAGPKI